MSHAAAAARILVTMVPLFIRQLLLCAAAGSNSAT
jgi:hypothetical protein